MESAWDNRLLFAIRETGRFKIFQAKAIVLEPVARNTAPAIAVGGTLGFVLFQHALRAGHVAASRASMAVVNPLLSVLIGLVAFGELLSTSPVRLVVELLGLFVLRCDAPQSTPRAPSAPSPPAADSAAPSALETWAPTMASAAATVRSDPRRSIMRDASCARWTLDGAKRYFVAAPA